MPRPRMFPPSAAQQMFPSGGAPPLTQQMFGGSNAPPLPPGDENDLTPLLREIYEEYPRFSEYGFEAARAPRGSSPGPGRLEFFSPDESHSPRPGVPFVEVYDPDLKGEELRSVLRGDMMHHLPSVDPVFAAMRREYEGSLTKEQREIDDRAYARARSGEFGYYEDRPQEDWMDISRLDQHLGGYLSPSENNEWAGSYTEEQVEILERIRRYLKGEK